MEKLNQSQSEPSLSVQQPTQQPQPFWTDADLIRSLVNGNSGSLYLILVLAILGTVAYIVKLAKQE